MVHLPEEPDTLIYALYRTDLSFRDFAVVASVLTLHLAYRWLQSNGWYVHR
jgi:hypothetical protein